MVPEIGKKYGPYEILGHLAGGGMGFVYRAWDARLHREVAIKLLHTEVMMPGMRERFLREARAASALNHPNICTIFDIGEQDGEPYLVMELLQGETLKDRIEYRSLQLEEILCISRDMAEALAAAHAKGIIHRDIKPANVFLIDKPNGSVQAKILDFGLAKFQGGAMGARTNRALDLTAAGATVGTLAYMSPEQARGETLDSRTDLFSMGVVIYEMTTRHIPFPGATSALVFVQLLNHQPEPVRNWNENVPRELDRIIFKLMAKERTQRFQTAQEVEEALSKVNEKSGGWLRKAAYNVPLVRAADPVPRETRPRRKSDDMAEADKNSIAAAESAPLASSDQPYRPGVHPAQESDAMQNIAEGAAAPIAEPFTVPGDTTQAKPPLGRVAIASAYDTQSAEQALWQDPKDFAVAVDFARDGRPDRESSRVGRPRLSSLQIGLIVLGLLALCVLAYLLLGHDRSALLTGQDPVVITAIENRTGDKALDGVVATGLQLALQESPYLRLDGSHAYRTALHQVAAEAVDAPNQVVARSIADRLQSNAYLYGTLTGSAAPYLIHLDLLNTASNAILASVDEPAPSREEIPVAIDRLAGAVRLKIGEVPESIARNSIPLAHEASANLDALHALAQGDAALYAGKTLDALRSYQHAAALDPGFVQAQLRLAELYRTQRAELAASDASTQALAGAAKTSPRTRGLAQFEFEMNALGDFVHAAAVARDLVTLNPHDSDALEKLSRCLRLQGRVAEALQTAQQAMAEDPFNLDAYTQAEDALIGLDRYAAAVQVDAQAQKLGVNHAGAALVASYLGGRQDLLDQAIAAIAAQQDNLRPDWSYGLYLDNIGHLAAGSELWRSRALKLFDVPGLESAGSFLLAQGAFDRALIGDCGAALILTHDADIHPEGRAALFNSGMAHALCGDCSPAGQIAAKLQQSWPHSFEGNGFAVADLKAAIALQQRDPATALELLQPARQFDLISPTPILRGQAHVALHQVQIGIVDFQTVLSHRGGPFIIGNVTFPAAQVGVARAFADIGDDGNSAAAYRGLLDLWKSADPEQPLLVEARAHMR